MEDSIAYQFVFNVKTCCLKLNDNHFKHDWTASIVSFVFQRPKRDWKPLEERNCTDLPWFLLFTLFLMGMVSQQFIIYRQYYLHICRLWKYFWSYCIIVSAHVTLYLHIQVLGSFDILRNDILTGIFIVLLGQFLHSAVSCPGQFCISYPCIC